MKETIISIMRIVLLAKPIALNERLFVIFLVFRPTGANISSRCYTNPICDHVECTMFNLLRLEREIGVCS